MIIICIFVVIICINVVADILPVMKNHSSEKKDIPDKELKNYVKGFTRARQYALKDLTYERVLQDKMLISYAVRRGVSYQVFEEIKSSSPFDDKQWCEFLNLNIRTLQRYRSSKNHLFKPLISERIFEIAEVISLGNTVFDTREDFKIWLMTPSPALSNEKPVSLLDNSYGIDLVISELNRIEYGIFI